MFELWVPAPCGWLNSNQRVHRMQVAKLTGVWRDAARMVWLAQKPASNALVGGSGCVRVVGHVWKPRRGRYDPGNLYPTAKACVDGFVEASDWLVDDDWQHVEGPDLRHGGVGPAGIRFIFCHQNYPKPLGMVGDCGYAWGIGNERPTERQDNERNHRIHHPERCGG